MSVIWLSDYRKNEFFDGGLTRLPPHPGPEHLELSTDGSPRGRGIPFPNDSFDAVYHSHFLEHLNKDDAPDFLLECYRVCKPSSH